MEPSDGANHGIDEIRQLIDGLSEDDHVRLMTWARYFYVGSGMTPGDLVQEVLVAVLSGARKCAKKMHIMPFLKSTMRSVAHGERNNVWNTRTVELLEEAGVANVSKSEDIQDDPQRATLVDDALDAILKACEEDPLLESIVLHKGFGSTPEEVQKETGITSIEYDSSLKRIKRLVQKTYPEGWDL